MKNILTAFAVFSLAAVLMFPLTSHGEDGGNARKTVFDMSHTEIFSPLKNEPLHYSGFYEMIKAGGPVDVNEGLITPATLKGVRTYVIAGPAGELTRDDIVILQSFVRRGGNLLVLLHIAPPVARLTESFGIIVSNFVVSEQENIIQGKSQDFYVHRFAKHPVTKGIKHLAVFGAWGLMADATTGSKVVASTTDKAWADLNRNRTLDEGEPVLDFGIVAVSRFGGGKVVVVADDAPFANQFLDKADNRKFAQNIIDWFNE